MTWLPTFEDIDLIVYLDAHQDEQVKCESCDNAATIRLVRKCCKQVFLKCDQHEVTWRIKVAEGMHAGKIAHCNVCSTVAPVSFDLWNVVPL